MSIKMLSKVKKKKIIIIIIINNKKTKIMNTIYVDTYYLSHKNMV